MKRPSWIHVVAVGTVAMLMGGILMGPASAHLNSPLTFKHLKKHFYTKKAAKKIFLQKTAANNLFLQKTAKAADAELIDGIDSTALARKIGNVLTVGKTGGDFTTITAALASITTASDTNPFLIMVGPGRFPERVVMKAHVDISGAGRDTTVITSGGAASCADAYTVKAAENAHLFRLEVENTGGAACAIGILMDAGIAFLRELKVTVNGATATRNSGVEVTGAGAVLHEVDVSALSGSGASNDSLAVRIVDGFGRIRESDLLACCNADDAYALYLDNSSADILFSNLSVLASGGSERPILAVNGSSDTVNIDASQLRGGVNSVNAASGYVVNAGASMLGAAVSGIGTFDCAQSYDSSYDAIGEACL